MANDKTAFFSNDVCIIGGGPAGVATALSLLQRGIRSTILEAAGSVKPKVGETLPPSVIPVLRVLGAQQLLDDPRHVACHGNSYQWGSAVAREKQFLLHTGGHGWHLQRDVLETGLLELAAEKGIDVCMGSKVMQAGYDPSGNWELQVRTGAHETTWTPRFVVDATGRNSKIARCMGIGRRNYDQLTGLVARFPLAEGVVISRLTHIEAVENGWWYAAACRDSIVTAFMSDPGETLKHLQQPLAYWQALQQTTAISSLLPDSYSPPEDRVIHTQSAGTSSLDTLYGTNWLAVGDAAFAYDPVSSYGITSALGSGCYAGHAIADHLQGMEEALPAYRYLTEKAFTDYLPLWAHQYRLEQRWKTAPFWSCRH